MKDTKISSGSVSVSGVFLLYYAVQWLSLRSWCVCVWVLTHNFLLPVLVWWCSHPQRRGSLARWSCRHCPTPEALSWPPALWIPSVSQWQRVSPACRDEDGMGGCGRIDKTLNLLQHSLHLVEICICRKYFSSEEVSMYRDMSFIMGYFSLIIQTI